MSRHKSSMAFLFVAVIAVASIATPSLAEACRSGRGHQAHASKSKKKVKLTRHLPEKKKTYVAKKNRVVDPIFEPNESMLADHSELIENEVATDLNKGKSSSGRYHVDAVDYFDQQAQVNEDL